MFCEGEHRSNKWESDILHLAKSQIDLFIEFFAPAVFAKVFQLVKADTRDAVAALVPELVEGLKVGFSKEEGDGIKLNG